MRLISLLLHKSEQKLIMNVNNKDVIQMHLGYHWLITQITLLINAEQHAMPYGFRLCSPIKASFVTINIFLGDSYVSTYHFTTDK